MAKKRGFVLSRHRTYLEVDELRVPVSPNYWDSSRRGMRTVVEPPSCFPFSGTVRRRGQIKVSFWRGEFHVVVIW